MSERLTDAEIAEIICNPHNPLDDLIFLPVLHYFAMDNIFTGSNGLFRFRAIPTVIMRTPKEVNMEESSIFCECWHGIFCYEKSQMEDSHTFAMSEEGREEMRQWLIDRIDKIPEKQQGPDQESETGETQENSAETH